MKRKLLTVVAAAVGPLILVICPVFAHHGLAAYDQQKVITLKGTITKFEFVNPHMQIYFDVRGDNDSVDKWAAETPSPNQMVRVGWSSHTLKPGDQVSLVGNPAKNGTKFLHLLKVVFPDGRELKAGGGFVDGERY